MERFSPTIATMHSVNEAVFINHIFHWMKHNQKNNINYRNGHYWMFGTSSEIQERLPFFSTDQIHRLREKLRKKNIIKTEYYHKKKSDRVIWYTIADPAILQICEDDLAKLRKGSCKSAKSSIETTKETTTKPISDGMDHFKILKKRLWGSGASLEQITVFSNGIAVEKRDEIYDNLANLSDDKKAKQYFNLLMRIIQNKKELNRKPNIPTKRNYKAAVYPSTHPELFVQFKQNFIQATKQGG